MKFGEHVPVVVVGMIATEFGIPTTSNCCDDYLRLLNTILLDSKRRKPKSLTEKQNVNSDSVMSFLLYDQNPYSKRKMHILKVLKNLDILEYFSS